MSGWINPWSDSVGCFLYSAEVTANIWNLETHSFLPFSHFLFLNSWLEENLPPPLAKALSQHVESKKLSILARLYRKDRQDTEQSHTLWHHHLEQSYLSCWVQPLVVHKATEGGLQSDCKKRNERLKYTQVHTCATISTSCQAQKEASSQTLLVLASRYNQFPCSAHQLQNNKAVALYSTHPLLKQLNSPSERLGNGIAANFWQMGGIFARPHWSSAWSHRKMWYLTSVVHREVNGLLTIRKPKAL